MSVLGNIRAEWPLRIGLGLMYLYSGLSLVRHPLDWQGFLPMWFSDAVSRIVPLTAYLKVQGIGELALAFVLLAWFLPQGLVRIAAGLAALEMAGILLFTGIDLVTFRDIGLLGAATALWVLTAGGREQPAGKPGREFHANVF